MRPTFRVPGVRTRLQSAGLVLAAPAALRPARSINDPPAATMLAHRRLPPSGRALQTCNSYAFGVIFGPMGTQLAAISHTSSRTLGPPESLVRVRRGHPKARLVEGRRPAEGWAACPLTVELFDGWWRGRLDREGDRRAKGRCLHD